MKAILTLLLPFVLLRASGQNVVKDSLIGNLIKKNHIPGLSYAIIKENAVIKKGFYGNASIELNVPITESSVYPIFSTTKAFTAIGALKLVEQGKLKLDDPISKYLDSLPENWKNISVYRLLTLTSGLPDVILEEAPGSAMKWVTEKEVEALSKLKMLPMQFQPGESWSYNQANLSLMGMIIQKITGLSYQAYMQKAVFEPLGMTNTLFADVRKVVPKRVSSYGLKQGGEVRTWNIYNYPDFALPNAGINTTLSDMVKFCSAILSNKLLKEEIQKNAYTVAKLHNNRDNYLEPGVGFGMGWMVMDMGGLTAAGMSGGAASGFLIFPKQKMAVVLLTNISGLNVEQLMIEIIKPYL